MIASKVVCDEAYSNRSCSIVGHGMFALQDINQMEREKCSYLQWQLNIEPRALKEFEQKVLYPTYILPSPRAHRPGRGCASPAAACGHP